MKIAGVLDLNKIDVLGLDENPLLEGDTVILTGFGAQTVSIHFYIFIHFLKDRPLCYVYNLEDH